VIFVVIIIAILLGNAVWWRWAHRRARLLQHPRFWQSFIAIFTSVQLGYIVLFVVAPPLARHAHVWLPMPIMGASYLWSLLFLPMTLLVMPIGAMLTRWRKRRAKQSVADEPIEGPVVSRRQALKATAIALPPLVTIGTTAWSIPHLSDLRVRKIGVDVADLPPNLDGLTIAQVTDTHIGKFTRDGFLKKVIETTNQLRAEVVVFAGDLVDLSLSDLPAGIDMINRLDPRHGLLMIEGNHDLIEDPDEFERRVTQANLPILLDSSRMLNIRGERIQFLGTRWGEVTEEGRRRSNNQIIRDTVMRVLAQRDSSAFPILLAHHPHAFDAAAESNIPLTLSGHTHGGQLMLTERLGAGPIMFRYWSGLYRKGNSSLVVSNGVGNWFPLRLNAPAEIVQITVRRATT
jgi:predicted MPP superfamily phosphohydrolase